MNYIKTFFIAKFSSSFFFMIMKNILFVWILFIFGLYGIFLRMYDLWNGSFWIDEGYSSIISYFALLNWWIPVTPWNFYEFSQYGFTLLQSMIFYLFWIDDFLARWVSMIFWIGMMWLFFIFLNDLLESHKYRKWGLIFGSIVFTFSTWQIIWSREARFYEMLAFFYFLITYILYRYLKTSRRVYLWWGIFLTFFWILFHPFFFWLYALLFIFILKELFQYKKVSIFIWFIISGWIYMLLQSWISYFFHNTLNFDIWPIVNSSKEYNFLVYLKFYLSVLYEQLGILFVIFMGTLVYLWVQEKQKWWFFLLSLLCINLGVISIGSFAHSRYIFHLFAIITLFGIYGCIIFFEKFYETYNHIFIRWIALLALVSLIFAIGKTYALTFVPQKFYYIDFTSPKPNFKSAYKYISTQYLDYEVVAWFPHMCYRYNLWDIDRCRYGIRVDLVGSAFFADATKKQQADYYTGIPYMDNLKQAMYGKYLFVFDDLTLKNTLQPDIINYVTKNCQMIYKDIWDARAENFIWIWKCQ